MKSRRRKFLKTMLAVPALTPATLFLGTEKGYAQPGPESPCNNYNLRPSLNAFSFNAALNSGSMTLDDLLEFCAASGFAAADLTAYYFPGYPAVPADDYLYHIKRKAFGLGLVISGTGVRNDFTEPDNAKRRESVTLVKRWIEAAEKLGAPVIRIFAGNQHPEGYTREQVTDWMLDDINACVDFGRQHGVVVAVQNHNDFIKTADQALAILNAINSPWCGLILDTGSYREGDPYDEIARTAGHAVNWQVKENVFINGKEVETDLEKLVKIIRASGYRGHLPIETLGQGDPRAKVTNLLAKLNNALDRA